MSMTMRYCGREFTEAELDWVRELLMEEPTLNRAQISRRVCESLGWYQPNGSLKQMSCRVALLRMHREGLITLPPPRNGNGNGRPFLRRSSDTDPGLPVCQPVHQLADLRLTPVESKRESLLWNEYMQRYHYQGYQPLAGAQLRYWAHSQGQVLALLGFGAASWKIAPRDTWIGWSSEQRQERLHWLVNNARFLILPWIESSNLASKLLAMSTRRLPDDWSALYGYSPVLLETFIEGQRFSGTCYRAANWVHVGQTQGRGKLDTHHRAKLPIKEIWLYPLAKDFRSFLCS